MISLIAAIDEKRGIGRRGKLPWHIPEDLKRFKELTKGHTVIMGRNTFESIGKPLPDRKNIIITTDLEFKINDLREDKDFLIVSSIEDAIEKAGGGEVFIIGGAQIFNQTINLADKIYLTKVVGNFNCDSFFPDYSNFRNEVFLGAGEENGIKYQFLELT